MARWHPPPHQLAQRRAAQHERRKSARARDVQRLQVHRHDIHAEERAAAREREKLQRRLRGEREAQLLQPAAVARVQRSQRHPLRHVQLLDGGVA